MWTNHQECHPRFNIPATNSCNGHTNAYVGGTIGIIEECNAKDGLCIIENSINMGKVLFNGNIGRGYYFTLDDFIYVLATILLRRTVLITVMSCTLE